MARMEPSSTFSDIRRRAINSGNDLLRRSAHVGFRDLLDPYCAEWHDSTLEQKLEIVQLLDTIDVSLADLCAEFQAAFDRTGRHDISAACPDALNYLLRSANGEVSA